MKIIGLLIFIFIMFKLNPVYSQGFNCITTPDGINIIAAGDSGKIFRSNNSGNNWFSMNIASVNFKSIFSLSDDVWIAGDNSIVYKTHAINSSLNLYTIPGNHTLNSIFFIDNSFGFVCGNNGVVFKSVNGGIDWISVNSGISSVNLNSISFKDLNKGIVVGNDGKVYTTTNGGTSWIETNTQTTKNLLKVKYFSDGIIIAGEYGTLILKQNLLWETIDTKIKTAIGGITGSGINDIHVCGGGGFIRNNKNGSMKFLNFEINPMMANLVDIFYYDNNLGFAVSSLNTSIIKTTNGGIEWTLPFGTSVKYTWDEKLKIYGGFGNTLCMHPYDPYTIFAVMGNKIYVSRNKGDDWTYLDSIPVLFYSAHSFYVSPVDTNIWVAAVTSAVDRIMKSTDYGNTWSISIARNFSTYGQPLEMDQNDPSVFYFAPDGGGFYKSTDNGSTFNLISDFPVDSPCDIIVKWDSSEVILVGDGPTTGNGAKVYRSSDSGNNWNLVFSSFYDEIPSMCNTIFDNKILYVMVFGNIIYKSTTFGNTFSTTYQTADYNWASAICLEDPNFVVAGAYAGPSYITTTGGTDWTTFTGGPTEIQSGLIAPDKSYAIAYRGSGLYKLKAVYSGLVSVHENVSSVNIPENYMLYQNYPNPFNPSTKIKFALPNSENISLKVYDDLGKEVITLANGFKNAGTYEISFDADNLTSGIYFYKLITGTTSITKKMLLVK
ncbi:MAG: T9SS type A sorting domain-containing protein [bacterium]